MLTDPRPGQAAAGRTCARLRIALVVVALAALLPNRLHAQAEVPPLAPIETDRPDFIESSVVVPRHYWQLENGMLYARTGALSVVRGTESLLRVGLTDRLEWRLGLPNVEWERGPGALGAGHGDAYAGIKWQVGPVGDWEFAVIPGLSLPVGASGRTSGAWDPELKLTFARDLPGGFDLAGMVAGALPTEAGVRTSTLQPALAVGRELLPGVRLFVEWVGAYQRDRESGHLAHTGIAWRATNHLQLDVHAGRRVAGDFPDAFVAFGLSFRRGPEPVRSGPAAAPLPATR